jgi:hypothetical protein
MERIQKIAIAAAVGALAGVVLGRTAYAAIKNKIVKMEAPPLSKSEMAEYQAKLNWFYDTVAGIKPSVNMASSGLVRVKPKSSGGYDGSWGPNTLAATHGFHDVLVKSATFVDASGLSNYPFFKHMADSCGGLAEVADQDKAAVALSKFNGRMSNYDLAAIGKALGVTVSI